MKEKTAEFKPEPLKLPDTGLQPARCFAIVDLGTHPKTYKGQPVINEKTGKQQESQELMFYFELPKFMNPGFNGHEPFPSRIKQQFTYSASPKAKLPNVLKSWGPMKAMPEKINEELLKKFVGHLGMLNIEHSADEKYANIGSGGRGVNPWMKDLPSPKKYNTPIFFDLEKFTWEAFYKLPAYSQKIIRKCIEFPSILAKMPEPIKTDGVAEAEAVDMLEYGDIVSDDGMDVSF